MCVRVCDIVEGAADGYTFMNFMLDKVVPIVQAGDFVIGDGARIHTGWPAEALTDVFASMGVRFVILPAYSCELNPIEMVFAVVKLALKGKGRESELLPAVFEAFADIDLGTIMRMYEHCGYKMY